ncbi:hypothetical protein EDB81DRAFT_794950 [Dactylonectria macrodidyma]|uniref:Secreted protein n=1 Tax=Dactylonectria macrodidyma TaxID=307937 RepID=A0A9P9EXH8_9HYPO|nr:hypothetical protein EDB81DRAFT_794950 [Dactylonectria macrodidyma]
MNTCSRLASFVLVFWGVAIFATRGIDVSSANTIRFSFAFDIMDPFPAEIPKRKIPEQRVALTTAALVFDKSAHCGLQLVCLLP